MSENYYRDGIGTNVESGLLPEQKQIVWIQSHSKYNVENQI
jgi:hypothetical protein